MNILLTSVGRRTYMINYFKEALEGLGQVHASNSIETYSMTIAHKSVISPMIYDNHYVDFLLDYCKNNKINAIISLFDIDLPILAKNKQMFSDNGIQIIVSDFDFVQVCNDKWLTYKFLTSNGFNTPVTFLSINESLQSLDRKEIDFPFIIKPRWGMGSIGIYQADNLEELMVLYKKTLCSINESYLKYESEQTPYQSVIIQEKLIGEEYGLDIFNNLKGNLLACVAKKKLAMRAGETDSAEIVENRELFEIGNRISKYSKHVGNMDVDCFLVDDKFYILEMNCRFGGQYPFSHLSGVNFPKAIINMLNNEKIDPEFLLPKFGIIGFKDLIPVKI